MLGATVEDLAKKYVGTDETGRIADADLRSRIVQHQMESRAFMLTLMRAGAEAKAGNGPSAAISIMKNAGSKVSQDRAELTLEIMGQQGLGWEGEGFQADELASVRGWLGGKAFTIFGGSYEIQNNIISKRVLGLLDHQ
jgi:alkylation response protein AidB-like acyl-CoA dehydrogenase